MTAGYRTRFAPSPTGFLHLGHVLSACHARDLSGRTGAFLIRIEDIDPQRCLPVYESALREDLEWLGFVADEPIMKQSLETFHYRARLDELRARGLVYPCTCSRVQIRQGSSGTAPDGSHVYGGRCRDRAVDLSQPHVWRLDMKRALVTIGAAPGWRELDGAVHDNRAEAFGDIVLARRDTGLSYHLCVTCDDARQNISLVTRGADLMEATSVHRVLQVLFGFPEPFYAHHPLLKDEVGRKLSKRDGSESLRSLRGQGYGAADVIALARKMLQDNVHSGG